MKRTVTHFILAWLVLLPFVVGSAAAVSTVQTIAPGDSVTLNCSTSLSLAFPNNQAATVSCAAGTPIGGAGPTAVPTTQATQVPTAVSTPVATAIPTLVPTTQAVPTPIVGQSGSIGIWRTPAQLALLPASGTAWNTLKAAADGAWGSPNLSDLNSNHDVLTLAGALVYARTGDAALRARVANAVLSAVGTESNSRGLEVSRNIVSYVLAADLIDFKAYDPTHEPAWRAWLSALRTAKMTDGRSIVSTSEDRPNNWGSMATASRIGIDRYLGDQADLDRAIAVYKGFLGDRNAYAGFSYGELSWQADPAHPVGVNPIGATIQGHSVDGVLPDDQRRSGSFIFPFRCGTYPWESAQGALLSAELLTQAGYPAYSWSDQALLRAARWLYDLDNCPAIGDDRNYVWMLNHAYGTSFPADASATYGKNNGWAAWIDQ